MKSTKLFQWVIIWYALHKRNLQKLMLQQITMLMEFYNILVCHQRVVVTSTKSPTKQTTFDKNVTTPSEVDILALYRYAMEPLSMWSSSLEYYVSLLSVPPKGVSF